MYVLGAGCCLPRGGRALLAQCGLQPLRGLLQLALQSLYLLGNILQLLLGDQACLGHLVCLAICFTDRCPNSYCHARQLIFPSHRALPQQMPAILYPRIVAAKHRFRVRQRRFLLSICATRAFTSFLTSEAGRGLSVGNWMVPLDMVKPLSSFLNASITDAVGNKLQCLENAANHTSTCLCLNAGIP